MPAIFIGGYLGSNDYLLGVGFRLNKSICSRSHGPVYRLYRQNRFGRFYSWSNWSRFYDVNNWSRLYMSNRFYRLNRDAVLAGIVY